MAPTPGSEQCEAVRSALARLAVGVACRESTPGTAGALPAGWPADRPPHFARHVRACVACRGFADRLARVRRWLEHCWDASRPGPSDAAALGRRIRQALVGELSARLARDLLGLAEGRPPRQQLRRERDVERLGWLLGLPALEVEPWASVIPVLRAPNPTGGRRSSDRARLLTFATYLDPQGLDLALAHLGVLVRQGLNQSADDEADRLLELVR